MPSASLLHWQNERMLRLTEVELQCAASLAAVPVNPRLIDENLRGYAVLLSAHFQGFSRDLYTEAAQVIVSKVRPTLRLLIFRQFSAHRKLDHGNPTMDNIAADIDRFGFDLRAKVNADPANTPRRQHLALLNHWRNLAAHQGVPTAAAGLLTLPSLQTWRNTCDGLATTLDAILYNHLRGILKRPPW
jgi:hypothetical protein